MEEGQDLFYIPENYNSPPTGGPLAIQTPTYPDKSPLNKGTSSRWGLHKVGTRCGFREN